MNRFSLILAFLCCLLCSFTASAQKITPKQHSSQIMRFVIEGKDTIYTETLPAAKVYDRLPRQKGREWRKYYRLVYNFGKVYPYALAARVLLEEADSTIAAQKMNRAKRERYINEVQKRLFNAFEKPMRDMTVSQGALLMKLIDRECGITSYRIIKDYKNRAAAGFWQGIAKMFGSDLKAPYDPKGADTLTEELIQLWEMGEYEGLYYSLFWEYPSLPEIPDEFLRK